MNFKNKYLAGTIRILFGLFMLFSGVSGFMALKSGAMQGVPEPVIEATNALVDSGIFHMIKVTEVMAGLMLVFNFLPALAAIFLAPIAVGIIIFNANLAQNLIIFGVIVAVLDIYLGYIYWDKYRELFVKS